MSGSSQVLPADSLLALRARLREFAEARDWMQFHTPKNLAMALAGEAGEVLEHFQWLTAEQSAAPDAVLREAVALELADVLMYLVRLADVLEVDLAEAAARKLAINEERYPLGKARGRADKYDQL
ncbi:nucleotide pyrophosphohydrolase [Azoarcus indigens]|uniref:NTP pyrophosphatase (Non-canonical NTP hydrolase) n=1 Tax=Azoarcus indigens TaxID=29545 RepID=A0A4R6EEP9_9RHOO|nr:nucleotide pyrophosphohydrolase [Azoarcus indigens]NMG65336.1 nucleotide pyrophosphohydrolase [Azoarcus indigens]TDN56720.1 NTP pyrophosphatase (non-canonical NTP hydrolase) [Azoarcus indigens]